MYKIENTKDVEKAYKYMNGAIEDLVKTEKDEIAVLSNISAFINAYMKDINWVGFYVMKEEELVLGPFQGGPACIRIKVGKGVCGTCVSENKVQLVPNVHEFPGHIACDGATNSEIVLPINVNGKVYGVLDIDSPELGRFGELEKTALIKTVSIIEEYLCAL